MVLPATAAAATRRPIIARALPSATRSHQTAARTKRSLLIPPHSSMRPEPVATTGNAPAATTIIYNPPSSAASPWHTPYKFLPSNDPRRVDNIAALFAVPVKEEDLPPRIEVQTRGSAPRYHLTIEDAREIQRLRKEDPTKWTITALARKFNCSDVFVSICTSAPKEHQKKLEEKLDVIKSRWGAKKTRAREDRSRRKEMLLRGEL